LETRTIGTLPVTVVGIGCNNFGWRIDARDTDTVVWIALDAGINFFDTADIYGSGQSEEFLGRALGLRRNEVIIATKFGMKMDERRHGARPEYVRQALEDSLKRLRTDRIDLYQLHQPDPDTPIADTLGAMNDLVRQGKVREIGCSNFSEAQIREAEAAARNMGGARFESVQNQYSLMHREPEFEVLPECERLGIAFLPYFPLANGLLTGKYSSGKPMPPGSRADAGWGPKVFTKENLKTADDLAEFAGSRGHTLLELAFSWLLSKRTVASVIAGAKSPAQVSANAAAANWHLTPEELSEIDRILYAD
jgi:aryl-alcohol dehydrogenase-like predicted oxidoreductase